MLPQGAGLGAESLCKRHRRSTTPLGSRVEGGPWLGISGPVGPTFSHLHRRGPSLASTRAGRAYHGAQAEGCTVPMARTPRITRGIQAVSSSTGLQTIPLAFLAEGETLTRVRLTVKAFFDPAPVTATTTLLLYGWAWGLYIDPDVTPASPLDPFADVNASWVWHEYTLTAYTVEGGNNIISAPPGDPVRDVKAQRRAGVDGAWLQWTMRTPTFTTDGWSASVGFMACILEV